MSQINEEKIELTRRFIRDLSALQDIHYDTLVRELNLTEEAKEFLFDYVFNQDDPFITTFKSHLELYNYDGPIYESETAK